MAFDNAGPSIRDWFNYDYESDVVLRFGDRAVYAHSNFLSGCSKVMAKEFSRATPKPTTSVPWHFEIPGYETDVVCALIQHIYGFDYAEHCTNRYSKTKLDFHLHVYCAADSYQIPSLLGCATKAIVDMMVERAEHNKDDPHLQYIFDRLINLHDLHRIVDTALFDALADFCIDRMPDFVETKCTFQDPYYRPFFRHMAPRWSGKKPASKYGPIILEDTCACKSIFCATCTGGWSRRFRSMIRGYNNSNDASEFLDGIYLESKTSRGSSGSTDVLEPVSEEEEDSGSSMECGYDGDVESGRESSEDSKPGIMATVREGSSTCGGGRCGRSLHTCQARD